MHWQPSHGDNHKHFDEEHFVHVRYVKVLSHKQDRQEIHRYRCHLQHDHREVHFVDLGVNVEAFDHDQGCECDRHDVGETISEEDDREQYDGRPL